MTDYEKEVDDLANRLIKEISSLPSDGTFKIRVNSPVTTEEKVETTFMLETLAKALGRPDVTVIVESKEDLN